MKKVFIFIILVSFLFVGTTGSVESASDVEKGTVFKGKSHQTLYYLSSDGKRYVFPNEKTYLSWYSNFDSVNEVDDNVLADFPLGGNIRYKPGVLLVKVETDPRVYAVSANGLLRWIKAEGIAKKLYGEHWNLLVDDVPDTFFANYSVGTAIDNEEEFDADSEEGDVSTIDENRQKRIKRKIHRTLVKRNVRVCQMLRKRHNRIQERLERLGITVDGVGGEFLNRCVDRVNDDTDTDVVRDGKVTLCHMPPGNRVNKHTLTVGSPAAKAHLSHGDMLGACTDEGDDNGGSTTDTTAPILSNVTAAAAATSTTVMWTTDEKSTSEVEYASESLETASTTVTVIDESLTTSHSVELTDLSTSTQYFFKVESSDDAGNKATSAEETFTTTS